MSELVKEMIGALDEIPSRFYSDPTKFKSALFKKMKRKRQGDLIFSQAGTAIKVDYDKGKRICKIEYFSCIFPSKEELTPQKTYEIEEHLKKKFKKPFKIEIKEKKTGIIRRKTQKIDLMIYSLEDAKQPLLMIGRNTKDTDYYSVSFSVDRRDFLFKKDLRDFLPAQIAEEIAKKLGARV